MIKLTNTVLIGLISATMLVGCGGSDSDDAKGSTDRAAAGVSDDGKGSTNGTNVEVNDDVEPVEPNNGTGGGMTATPPPVTTTSAKTFTEDVIPVLESKCKSCHGDNGNFTITTASATYANISDLKASIAEAGKYLYDKGSNTIGHGGGAVVGTGSVEYATIKSWVDSGADFN